MDDQRFDRVTRAISPRLPRRALAGLLGLGATGLGTLGLMNSTDAKKKKKNKKKVKRNEFDCVDVGDFCKNNSQCCSGICSGKKNKKCKAHDQSTCQAGQDSCLGTEVQCTTTTGAAGNCVVTTGKASYCYGAGDDCVPCSKDSECVPIYGAGAACIVCAFCLNQTPQGRTCVGLGQP